MITKLKELVRDGTEEYRLAEQIDKDRIPVHVAVIMDGNGRWAKQHKLKREEGHKVGAESARKITEYALRCGVKYLTLFAFSSENWKRPIKEVNTLMNMLYENLVEQKGLLMDNKIRFNIVGDSGRLPGKLKKKLQETIDVSSNHQAMQLNLALNYGSRMEIVTAVKRIAQEKIPARKIDEKLLSKYLYTGGMPDPDLMIRTSGELRISNFLLYQLAYAELYFTPVMWPDFRLKQFLEALLDFQNRERRFGKV
jgi:undecaprenyl diphosphate synthase